MKQTYMNFICEQLGEIPVGNPIYTGQIAEKVGVEYNLSKKEASAAVAVAVKRILDGRVMPDLRCYQREFTIVHRLHLLERQELIRKD